MCDLYVVVGGFCVADGDDDVFDVFCLNDVVPLSDGDDDDDGAAVDVVLFSTFLI